MPFGEPVEFPGEIELALDAEITALDTGWIAVLYDVPPQGEVIAITAGWLRASLSEIDPERSRIGAPVPPCRHPTAIVPRRVTTDHIPLVPNARHLAAGHRLRLVIASADESGKPPTLLGFTHTVVRESSRNTVLNNSELWLPLLPPSRHRSSGVALKQKTKIWVSAAELALGRLRQIRKALEHHGSIRNANRRVALSRNCLRRTEGSRSCHLAKSALGRLRESASTPGS